MFRPQATSVLKQMNCLQATTWDRRCQGRVWNEMDLPRH